MHLTAALYRMSPAPMAGGIIKSVLEFRMRPAIPARRDFFALQQSSCGDRSGT
jgi:hypothetical protein